MDENKKSFLDDLAAEKPESFNEEVFIKSKRNYVPIIVLSTLVIAIFGILYFTFTKGSVVPDMTDWKEQEVYAWANANHGTIVKEDTYSLDIPEGILISQDIAAGKKLRRNGTLKVTISRGADPNEKINFPDIKAMNLKEIESWIEDNQLQGVTVKKENNSVFEKDSVISYEFTDGSESNFLRKNRLKIFVSLGKEELKDTITVPNLTGKLKGDVIQWASEYNIDVEILEDYNEYVEYGKVYHQSIEGNTKMKRDDKLTITLSLGKAIIVPSFVGLHRDEALDIAKLNNMELFFKNQISSKKEGTIIEQDVEPGSKVSSKELITITVAATSDMIIVPNLVGLDQSEASTLASLYNMKTFFVTKSSTEKSGKVIEQSHSSGSNISSDTLVTIYVSSGDIALPDFIGLSKNEADLIADENDLSIIFKEENSSTIAKDEILEQSIMPKTIISKDTKLILTVADNNGHLVPDFSSMTKNEIEAWASSHDTNIKFVEEYSNTVPLGQCFKQNYINSYVPSNDSLLVSESLGLVPIDNFQNKSKLELSEWLNEVNAKGGQLTINTFYSYDSTQPEGTVVDQSVINDFITTGSTIDVWVAASNVNNTVPDFTWVPTIKATEWCNTNGVSYKVIERYSSDITFGYILGQNITNQAISSGESLVLYQSIGPLKISSFVGRTKQELLTWVNNANLAGANINLSFDYSYKRNYIKDLVLSQSIKPGDSVLNSDLSVVISSEEYMKIPDFTNMQLSEAIQILNDLGLEYETQYLYVSEAASSLSPVGTVLSQNITGEIKYEEIDTITLSVSRGSK